MGFISCHQIALMNCQDADRSVMLRIVVKTYGYNLAVLNSVMLHTTNGLIIKTDRHIEMTRQWRYVGIQKRPAKAVDPIKLIILYREA